MICPYCGNENPDNLQKCDFCGGPLEIPAEEQITEGQPFGPAIDHFTESQPTEPIETQTSSQPPISHTAPSLPPSKSTGGIYGNRIWWFVGCLLIVIFVLGCGAVIWALFNISDRLPFINPATATRTFLPVSTVMETPVLVPSLVPLPILTVTANPISSTSKVLFSDDFSDTGSGWDRVDQADFYTDYYENAYRIIVNSDMSDSWANPDDNLFRDVIVEVDATKNAGPDDNDFGLICRYQGVEQFYYGVISSDGYFGITKVTSSSSDLIGRDSLEFSDAINQGLATNHIRFDCTGNVLTLYVNGQQVDQQTDSDYSTGNVGLLAGTYDTAGTDILFDNFIVYQP